MNTLILVGGLVVLGVVFINRTVPNVAEELKKTTGQLEYEKTKQLGIANVGEVVKKEVKYYNPETNKVESQEREVPKGPYMQCTTDSVCQGDALIGAKYRCIGARCLPLVGMRGVFGITSLYNPIELGLTQKCNKYWLMGEGSGPCTRNTQCSTSGITCDPDDSSCMAERDVGPDDVYCGDDKLCHRLSNKDWLGVRYRHDTDPGVYYKLGVDRQIDKNFGQIDILSQTQSCPELKQLKVGH